jgi:sulfite reductase (NADPH) hemoprotein beta-component
MNAPTDRPPSGVERIKRESRHLRGTIAQGLADSLTGAIAADDTALLKFHGSYQQDDRDLRDERRRQKLEPAYAFMIRVRLPGGVLTPAQWLALDDLAGRYANGTLRLTTRQTFQFHGVGKRHLKAAMQAIHAAGLDTVAACGDVNRNVIATANPYLSPAHAAVGTLAREVSQALLPRTRAYREIWLDAPPSDAPEEEPLYGEVYLPRKFKIGLAVPPHNDVDVYAQDLAFVAHVGADGAVDAYTVLVGGGMGMTHGDRATYPRLAEPLGACAPEEVIAVAREVLAVQRDFGDRSERKHARLKYTLDDHGLVWFRGEVEARLGSPLAPPLPFTFTHNGDVLGWAQGPDGRSHYTLFVENGRVADFPGGPALRTALRELMHAHTGPVCLTTNQNLTLAGIAPEHRPAIEALIARHGLEDANRASTVRRHSIACVALPTCGLAMAESERYLPRFVDRLEQLIAQAGLAQVPITVRMSGCPNGCSRPYIAEIALVGKGPGKYNLYLGAGFHGERLGKLYRENIGEADLLAALAPLLEHYARERLPGEHFGDFTVRAGYVAPVTVPKTDYHAG